MTTFSDFVVGEPTADLGGDDQRRPGQRHRRRRPDPRLPDHGHQQRPVRRDRGAASTIAWPAGFSQGPVSPSQGSCAPIGAGPDRAAAWAPIAAGGERHGQRRLHRPGQHPRRHRRPRRATVSSPAVDPVAADNSAADATTVVESAGLVVTKDDGQASVVAGTGGHACTITVTNSGPSDADSVLLDDAVPARAHRRQPERRPRRRLHRPRPATRSPAACRPASPPARPGRSASRTRSARASRPRRSPTPPSPRAPRTRPASSATDETDVTAAADLGGDRRRRPGQRHRRRRPDPRLPDDRHQRRPVRRARGQPRRSTWPAGFSQGPVSPSQGSCAPIGAGPDLELRPGHRSRPAASATVSVAYTVPASTAGGPQTATVDRQQRRVVDPVAADNSAADATTVVESAAWSSTKDDGQASVVAGTGGHAYTITVTNSGPSDADSVVVDDAVPAAFTAGSPSADLGGDCTRLGRQRDPLQPAGQPRPGATWTISVPYAVGAGVPAQTVTNTRHRDERREPGRRERHRRDRRHDHGRPRR